MCRYFWYTYTEPTLQQINEEGEGEPQNTETQDPREVLQDNWEPELSQYYMWDDKVAEGQTPYRSSPIRIVPEENTTMKIMAAQTSAAPNRAAELMYHYWNKIHWQPKRLWEDYRTPLGYWEINGVKTHCLLDSGSEGVLLSPEFMWAMGIKTFALETPIALQLACIGSNSTINYGTNAKIKFNHTW